MPAKKPLSGTARMKARGLKGFSLAMTPQQKELLEKAATLDGRSLTQFLIYHGLRQAEKIISKNPVT